MRFGVYPRVEPPPLTPRSRVSTSHPGLNPGNARGRITWDAHGCSLAGCLGLCWGCLYGMRRVGAGNLTGVPPQRRAACFLLPVGEP